MARQRNWKDKAYDYMQNEINYLVFDRLYQECEPEQQHAMDEYMEFLERQSGKLYFLMEAPPKSGQMFVDFEPLMEAYLDNLNVDWIMHQPNGLEIAMNGARMWLSMIGMYFD